MENMLTNLKLFVLKRVYEHDYCLNSNKLHKTDIEYYNSVINKKVIVKAMAFLFNITILVIRHNQLLICYLFLVPKFKMRL